MGAFPRVPSRLHRTDKFWDGKKKPFAIAVVASSLLLQILFLLNYCYLFGSLFKVTHRTHSLKVLMVNYDQGVISKSLEAAVSSLKADTFLGVHPNTPVNYPDPSDVYSAVRNGDYWAAIYTHAGASDRLTAALAGGDAAKAYNTSDVISYVFNEARYAAPSDGYIKSQLEQLVQVTRVTYNHMNGTGALQALNQQDPVALQVLLTPWMSDVINIQPTTQGDRVLYNTAAMVFPIIMQFFCLMAINGISAQFSLYSHLPVLDNNVIRNTLASVFTLIGSLCLTGAVWAFKEGWPLGGGQFMCLWVIIWLYMHINFLVMDVATAYIPMKMLPFFVFTWVIVNVTSTIFPFELNPGFYRIGYAFPAHEVWQVIVQIYTGGAPNRLYRALPILFVYEIVLLPCANLAMRHRCVIAARAEQEEAEEEAAAEQMAREEAYHEEQRQLMARNGGAAGGGGSSSTGGSGDSEAKTVVDLTNTTVEEKSAALAESDSNDSSNEHGDLLAENGKVVDRMQSFRSLRSAAVDRSTSFRSIRSGGRGVDRNASFRSVGGNSAHSIRRSKSKGSQRSARERLAAEYWPSVPVPFSGSLSQPQAEPPLANPPPPAAEQHGKEDV